MRTLTLAVAALALAATARADGPAIDVSELDNGLDLIVVEKHDAPLVTIEIAVRTGAFTETPATNGLSHLYEHMFFKGNAALPTQEAYMARVSELGISFNGTTSTERVNYFITLPSRNFAPGMKFMADAILAPLFNEAEMVAERKVVIGEYDRNEANPAHYLHVAMRDALYGAESYRKNPLGERDVILSATQDTMRDFKARFYVPNNAALFVTGDVNATEVKVLAEQLLGMNRWPQGEDPHFPPRSPLPRLSTTQAFVVSEPDAVVGKSQAIVLAAHWPGPDVGRDERATFVADVWGTLCGQAHGRLQRTFRDGGLAEGGASLGYYTQREGGEVHFQCAVKDGKVRQAREALEAEVAAMAGAGYFTEEDLALAKRTLRIGRAYEAQQGEELTHNLSFWWASSDLDYYTRYLEETDSVTLDEVASFVRNYMVGRPMVIGCLASKANVQRHELSAELLRPAAAGATAAASGVEELTLDNGIKVVLRREPGSALSALDVCFAGGCVGLPADKQGVDALLFTNLFEGSERRTRQQVQQTLAALGARPGADANYDYGRLSIVAPSEGFADAVDLLADCLRSPRFAPDVFEQGKSGRVLQLQQEQANAEAFLPRLVNTSLFAGHPYALRPDGTLEAVQTLRVDDLKPRLAQLLVSGRVLLVLVGDLDKATAKELLQARFGWIPKGPFVGQPELPAFRASKPVLFEPRNVPTTYIMAKFALPGPAHPDFAATRLTLGVLRRRLWDSLRTRHALTYAPGAGVSQWRTNFGVMSASTTQPARAAELMWAEVRRLQAELVPASELQGLIAQEETGSYERNESVSTHANGLSHAALVAGGWRRHYELPVDLTRITAQDVLRIAREHLKDFTWGIIGPAAVADEVLQGRAGGPPAGDAPATPPARDGQRGAAPSPRPAEQRAALPEQLHGEAAIDAGVAAALGWLGRHQDPDGRWGGEGWASRCADERCAGPDAAGDSKHDVGLTALALLAYLGAPDAPERRPVVERAIAWLLLQQQETGAIGVQAATAETIYDHAYATQALCEALVRARTPELEAACRRAVEFITGAQNPNLGWRYGARSGRNDTAVTGAMVQALVAAQAAGLEVPAACLEGGRSWLLRVTDASGDVGYEAPGGISDFPQPEGDARDLVPTMTAVSLAARLAMGERRTEGSVRKGVKILLDNLPAWPRPEEARRANACYWAAGTRAMARMGGPGLEAWTVALSRALLPRQRSTGCADGSWDPVADGAPLGGRVYATAMHARTLATLRGE